jgi:uncharacterized Zn finger protein
MTALNSIPTLTLSALRDASPERLHKAVCGLTEGSLTVTLTRHSAGEIRALVKNGDGLEYGVTLTDTLTTCSCKDALYRGVVCKHAVAVALHTIRNPQDTLEVQEAPKPYDLSLGKARKGFAFSA